MCAEHQSNPQSEPHTNPITSSTQQPNPNASITQNFRWGEFRSPDGEPFPVDILKRVNDLAQRLQVLRDLSGNPMTITSGYRSPSHNQTVGGAPYSYHVRGMACDIPKRQIPQWLETRLWDHWSGGMGRYVSHIHLDIGPRRRWNR